MGPVTTALLELFVFVITCLVCLASFIMAIALLVLYLGAGRPVGAPYVFKTLSSTVPLIIRDEETEHEALRSEFGGENKKFLKCVSLYVFSYDMSGKKATIGGLAIAAMLGF